MQPWEAGLPNREASASMIIPFLSIGTEWKRYSPPMKPTQYLPPAL